MVVEAIQCRPGEIGFVCALGGIEQNSDLMGESGLLKLVESIVEQVDNLGIRQPA